MSAESVLNAKAPILIQLQNFAFQKAKFWSIALIGLQAFLFTGGFASIFSARWSLSYPWLAFPLAVVGALISVHATDLKGRAEWLKRQHEFLNGLGVTPSARTLTNLQAELPSDLKPGVDRLLTEGVTYASEQSIGLPRLLENVCESAFFSHHLASRCARYLLILLVFTGTIASSLLLFCLSTLQDATTGVIAARAIAATLVFLISVGTIKSWRGYVNFSSKADLAYSEATRLLKDTTPDSCEAHRVVAEYQLARANAPMIPTKVWLIHRDHLNKIWLSSH
jgi:hypothetical protein